MGNSPLPLREARTIAAFAAATGVTAGAVAASAAGPIAGAALACAAVGSALAAVRLLVTRG